MGASLFDSIGIIDNLDDPEPFLNKKPVIYGFILAFLVRPSGRLLCAPSTFLSTLSKLSYQ